MIAHPSLQPMGLILILIIFQPILTFASTTTTTTTAITTTAATKPPLACFHPTGDEFQMDIRAKNGTWLLNQTVTKTKFMQDSAGLTLRGNFIATHRGGISEIKCASSSGPKPGSDFFYAGTITVECSEETGRWRGLPQGECTTSCVGRCGKIAKSGCYCDEICVSKDECCVDFVAICKSTTPTTTTTTTTTTTSTSSTSTSTSVTLLDYRKDPRTYCRDPKFAYLFTTLYQPPPQPHHAPFVAKKNTERCTDDRFLCPLHTKDDCRRAHKMLYPYANHKIDANDINLNAERNNAVYWDRKQGCYMTPKGYLRFKQTSKDSETVFTPDTENTLLCGHCEFKQVEAARTTCAQEGLCAIDNIKDCDLAASVRLLLGTPFARYFKKSAKEKKYPWDMVGGCFMEPDRTLYFNTLNLNNRNITGREGDTLLCRVCEDYYNDTAIRVTTKRRRLEKSITTTAPGTTAPINNTATTTTITTTTTTTAPRCPGPAKGCRFPSRQGNEFCEGANNVCACDWDDGDCCDKDLVPYTLWLKRKREQEERDRTTTTTTTTLPPITCIIPPIGDTLVMDQFVNNTWVNTTVKTSDFLRAENGVALRGPFPSARKGEGSFIHCERTGNYSRGPDPKEGLYIGRVNVPCSKQSGNWLGFPTGTCDPADCSKYHNSELEVRWGGVKQGLTDANGLVLNGPWLSVLHGATSTINCATYFGPPREGGGMGRNASYWAEVCLDHSAVLWNSNLKKKGLSQKEKRPTQACKWWGLLSRGCHKGRLVNLTTDKCKPQDCEATVGGLAPNTEGQDVLLSGRLNRWKPMKHGEWQTLSCLDAADRKHPTQQGDDRWMWKGEVRRQCLYGVMQKIQGACTPIHCDGTIGVQSLCGPKFGNKLCNGVGPSQFCRDDGRCKASYGVDDLKENKRFSFNQEEFDARPPEERMRLLVGDMTDTDDLLFQGPWSKVKNLRYSTRDCFGKVNGVDFKALENGYGFFLNPNAMVRRQCRGGILHAVENKCKARVCSLYRGASRDANGIVIRGPWPRTSHKLTATIKCSDRNRGPKAVIPHGTYANAIERKCFAGVLGRSNVTCDPQYECDYGCYTFLSIGFAFTIVIVAALAIGLTAVCGVVTGGVRISESEQQTYTNTGGFGECLGRPLCCSWGGSEGGKRQVIINVVFFSLVLLLQLQQLTMFSVGVKRVYTHAPYLTDFTRFFSIFSLQLFSLGPFPGSGVEPEYEGSTWRSISEWLLGDAVHIDNLDLFLRQRDQNRGVSLKPEVARRMVVDTLNVTIPPDTQCYYTQPTWHLEAVFTRSATSMLVWAIICACMAMLQFALAFCLKQLVMKNISTRRAFERKRTMPDELWLRGEIDLRLATPDDRDVWSETSPLCCKRRKLVTAKQVLMAEYGIEKGRAARAVDSANILLDKIVREKALFDAMTPEEQEEYRAKESGVVRRGWKVKKIKPSERNKPKEQLEAEGQDQMGRVSDYVHREIDILKEAKVWAERTRGANLRRDKTVNEKLVIKRRYNFAVFHGILKVLLRVFFMPPPYERRSGLDFERETKLMERQRLRNLEFYERTRQQEIEQEKHTGIKNTTFTIQPDPEPDENPEILIARGWSPQLEEQEAKLDQRMRESVSAYFWLDKPTTQSKATVHPMGAGGGEGDGGGGEGEGDGGAEDGTGDDLFAGKRGIGGGFRLTPLPYVVALLYCVVIMAEPVPRLCSELFGYTDKAIEHLGVGVVVLTAFAVVLYMVLLLACAAAWAGVSLLAFVFRNEKALLLYNDEREAWVRPVIAPVAVVEQKTEEEKKAERILNFVKPSKRVPERVTGCTRGMPYNRLVNLTKENILTSDKKDFMCMVCQHLAADPVVTSCGHIFCYTCAQDWAKSQTADWAPCPSCHSALGLRRADKQFTNIDKFSPEERDLYLTVVVTCQSDKCGWTGPLGSIQEHWDKECGYNEQPDPETTVDAATRVQNIQDQWKQQENDDPSDSDNSDEDDDFPGDDKDENPPEPVENVALETARENQELLSQWLGDHHSVEKALENPEEALAQAAGRGVVVPQRAHMALLPQYQVWSMTSTFYSGCRKGRGGVFFVPLFGTLLVTQGIVCAVVKEGNVQVIVNLVLGLLEIIFLAGLHPMVLKVQVGSLGAKPVFMSADSFLAVCIGLNLLPLGLSLIPTDNCNYFGLGLQIFLIVLAAIALLVPMYFLYWHASPHVSEMLLLGRNILAGKEIDENELSDKARRQLEYDAWQILIAEGYDKTMALKALFVTSFDQSLDIRPARHWLDLYYPSKLKDYTKPVVVGSTFEQRQDKKNSDLRKRRQLEEDREKARLEAKRRAEQRAVAALGKMASKWNTKGVSKMKAAVRFAAFARPSKGGGKGGLAKVFPAAAPPSNDEAPSKEPPSDMVVRSVSDVSESDSEPELLGIPVISNTQIFKVVSVAESEVVSDTIASPTDEKAEGGAMAAISEDETKTETETNEPKKEDPPLPKKKTKPRGSTAASRSDKANANAFLAAMMQKQRR